MKIIIPILILNFLILSPLFFINAQTPEIKQELNPKTTNPQSEILKLIKSKLQSLARELAKLQKEISLFIIKREIAELREKVLQIKKRIEEISLTPVKPEPEEELEKEVATTTEEVATTTEEIATTTEATTTPATTTEATTTEATTTEEEVPVTGGGGGGFIPPPPPADTTPPAQLSLLLILAGQRQVMMAILELHQVMILGIQPRPLATKIGIQQLRLLVSQLLLKPVHRSQ